MEREIERCIEEQAKAAAYLASGPVDPRGGWLWASDLIKEEILLRRGCEK